MVAYKRQFLAKSFHLEQTVADLVSLAERKNSQSTDTAETDSLLQELTRLALEIDADPVRRSALPGVRIYVEPLPTSALPVLFDPVLYVVLQGEKQLLLDDRVVRYNQSQLVIVTVNLPALAQVLCAGPGTPYVAVGVPLDRSTVAELMCHVARRPRRSTRPSRYTRHPLTSTILSGAS
ncbi:AraC family transcriptional regulator [Amycolatopsis sp. H20-H5]|nr:AraC family transcriptional regulator [Amycolatopsis sp. H20-H5]MEC3981021.1 AraC family transcriptional regulator [Amycolatopsis sp. H20-H5]